MKLVDAEDLRGGEMLDQWPYGEVLAIARNRRLSHYWNVICLLRRPGHPKQVRVERLCIQTGGQVRVRV